MFYRFTAFYIPSSNGSLVISFKPKEKKGKKKIEATHAIGRGGP
jgi:hypothetical protein